MVAVIAGNGQGLFNTSLDLLGNQGVLGSSVMGQGGGRDYVNAATGGLVLQATDATASGAGVDLDLLRTYNSNGTLGDDVDGNGWRWNAERTVVFNGPGTPAQPVAGSTVTRTNGDGAKTVYTWNSASCRYLGTDGGGANDYLTYQANTWTWVDGSTHQKDVYGDSASAGTIGRLQSQTDASGNQTLFHYDGTHRLDTITDLGSGQFIQLVYSGTAPQLTVNTYELPTDPATGRLTGAPITAGTPPLRQVRYTYDGTRIGTVTTVVNPGETTARYFTTTYAYVSPTDSHITSVTQNDGSAAGMGTPYRVGFTYDAQGRVATVQDANGLQTFHYATSTRTDIVVSGSGGVDPQTWSYSFDPASGQLKQVLAPPLAPNAASLVTTFLYDAAGNVSRVTGNDGRAIIYQYDADGNVTLQRDSAGDTVSRTYDANDNLLTETRYLTPDPVVEYIRSHNLYA